MLTNWNLPLLKNLTFKSFVTIAFFAAICLTAANAEAQNDDSDFQVWNETTLVVPVIKKTDDTGKESDRLSLLLIGVLRLGQDRLYPVERRFGGGFDLTLNEFLSFSPTYIYRRGEPTRGDKEYEHRLRFDVTFRKKWSKFSIKDRNRIEYRIRHSNDDSVRYRNKFTISVPIQKDGKTFVTAFASEEIFYEFNDSRIGSNEIMAGIGKDLSKAVSAELFYVRRDIRSGQVRNVNGVGVNFKVRLD